MALRLFFRKIVVNKPDCLSWKGPILIAANHPNSFLDAVVLDALFEKPIWSLARGDAFRNKFIRKLLHRLCILPVYRDSEGVENLSINYSTFAKCEKIFQQNGLVLIFSEGRCINEWKLRPLKKGTARLAFQSWQKEIPLNVLPIGINYSSFRQFGKDLHLEFGTPLNQELFSGELSEGSKIRAFNSELENQLQKLVVQASDRETESWTRHFSKAGSKYKNWLLAPPAFLGWILHAPLYLPIRKIIHWKARESDHYDSILFALLLLCYPAYLLMLMLIFLFAGVPAWNWLLLFLLPITAWSWLQWKVTEELDRNNAISIAA